MTLSEKYSDHMTVYDLIRELSQFPPNAVVIGEVVADRFRTTDDDDRHVVLDFDEISDFDIDVCGKDECVLSIKI